MRWRVALWAAMLLGVGWIALQARWSLLPFSVGALFAYVLTPAVDRVAGLLPARSHQENVVRRGFAVLVVYLALAGGLTGAGLVVVPIAIDETAQFIDELPELIDETQLQVNSWLEEYRARVPEDARMRIDEFVADLGDQIGERLSSGTEDSIGSISTAIAVTIGFLVVPVWMFYALRDRHSFERNFSAAVPSGVRADVLNAVRIADELIGRYLRGQLLLGLLVGIAIFIGLTVIGVDLAIALAIFAGVTELIPIIGPWIGALPALVIVAATDPDKIVWVLLLYLGVQLLENNVLVPRVQGHAVDIHPAMIILMLAVAGTVFGFVGLLLVMPLTGLLRELFWYLDHRLSGETASEAMASSHVAKRLGLSVTDGAETPDSAAAVVVEPDTSSDESRSAVSGGEGSSGEGSGGQGSDGEGSDGEGSGG